MTEEITDLYGEVDQEAMYQAAIHQPLERKIEQAIGLIRLYGPVALSASPEGMDVANSGGKDSTVIMDLVRKSEVKFQSHYGNTTIDPPELLRHLKTYFPETRWISIGKHLTLSTHEHAGGLPTRHGKWCCEIYKHNHGEGLQVVGVRAEESKRRKGLWNMINVKGGNTILAPILYWTETDVWNYIRANNLPYCSLYDEGFTRLGCVGCPNSNRHKEFKRWPKYEALWKRGGRVWWEKYKDKLKPDGTHYFAAKFPTFESYWSWWMEDKNANDGEADCQLWLW